MLWSVLLACAPSDGDGPVALYGGACFFDHPWPSDDRRTADGGLDLATFPNPWSVALLDDYVAFVATRQGFGTQSPVYVRFDGAIDPSALPLPEESTDPASPVMLVDVDPDSPDWLSAVPLQFAWEADAATYLPGNLLAAAPLFGFPLRPGTTYALVITTELARAAPDFQDALAPGGDPGLEGLRAALPLLGLDPDDVAVATSFTTMDPLDEMRRLVRMVRHDIGLPSLDLDATLLSVLPDHTVYRTHYPSPRFTHGTRPYLTEGGGFVFRADGQPVIEGWDDMRLAVCVPHEPAEPPPSGWPVVIQQHGTGGDYLSHCNSSSDLEVARQLGNRGFVSLGIEHPLHGTRNGDALPTDLANFNLFNPDSATSNFRQGALDAIYLARALREGGATFHLPGGGEVPVDPTQVSYFGHSQGGLTGSIAAPFFAGDVRAMVLSGAGGTLAITIVDRKDVLDFAQLLSDALQFDDSEAVTELHPVVGLIQTAVEVTDPVNYAPFWFHEAAGADDVAPIDILLTSGTEDAATPYRTAVALAAAGHVPVLAPGATRELVFELRGTADRQGPLQDDVERWDGRPGTAGVAQWKGEDHYLVFENTVAADVYGEFLERAAQGEPAIGRPKDFR